MKIPIEVDGRLRHVEATRADGTVWRVTVDGQALELDVVEGHALVSGRSYPFAILRDPEGFPVAATVRGEEFPLRVEGLRRPAAARPGRRGLMRKDPAGGRVTAPMNGQVVKVLHAVGDEVHRGDVVLVLEAMKMENEVAAPTGGRIAALDVGPGVAVKPGDPLFTVAPHPT